MLSPLHGKDMKIYDFYLGVGGGPEAKRRKCDGKGVQIKTRQITPLVIYAGFF